MCNSMAEQLVYIFRQWSLVWVPWYGIRYFICEMLASTWWVKLDQAMKDADFKPDLHNLGPIEPNATHHPHTVVSCPYRLTFPSPCFFEKKMQGYGWVLATYIITHRVMLYQSRMEVSLKMELHFSETRGKAFLVAVPRLQNALPFELW